MAIKVQGDTVIFDDKSFRVGSGSAAERPASPGEGQMWFNTDTNSFEAYYGSIWVSLGTGGAEISDTVPSDPEDGEL